MSKPTTLSTIKFRKFEYFWLVYLVFFFIEPIIRGSLHYWLECLGIVAVFLALYVSMIHSDRARSKLLLIGGMWILGVVTLPMNGGASAFIIYAAALLPFAITPPKWVLSGIVSISALLLLESWRLHFNWFNTGLNIFFVLVVGGSNIFFAQKQRDDCKLRAAQEENLALAAVAERERIARDLHDVLGHTLSVIVLKAELAGRLINHDPQRAASEIGDVERIARTALAEVREAIGGYRARGLAAEIEAARRTLDSAGVTLILDSASGADSLPTASTALTTAEETVLALVLREAVTNIVRHARAKTCRLHFVTEQGHRRLLVEDDGEHPLVREGNGLRGMRERVEAIGGHVSLNRDSGTRILIELPLRAETAA
jgi:two-component system sensor histidine kinase DesK